MRELNSNELNAAGNQTGEAIPIRSEDHQHRTLLLKRDKQKGIRLTFM